MTGAKTTIQVETAEQMLNEIVRCLPPDRLAELVDFARFLDMQSR